MPDSALQSRPVQHVAAIAATAPRRELKFALRNADLGKIERVLECNLKPIAFGNSPISHVNSIYFDDARLTACEESMAGVTRRTKLRVRWYDQPLPAGDAHFELKHHIGATIQKARVPLRIDESMHDYRTLIERLAPSLDQTQACWLALRNEPTVMVCYKRRHFRDPATGIRVTLDFDITGYDQRGSRRIIRRFPAMVDGQAVIEVKTPEGDDRAAAALLHPLALRLTRFSKYVLCCQRMGWGGLSDRYE